jgi:predicted DNA-binding transcriptional regulator AlpA
MMEIKGELLSMQKNNPRLISGPKAAYLIGVSKATWYRWQLERTFPFKVVKVGKRSMYDLQDIEDYANGVMEVRSPNWNQK